jgi:hypothetical protein
VTFIENRPVKTYVGRGCSAGEPLQTIANPQLWSLDVAAGSACRFVVVAQEMLDVPINLCLYPASSAGMIATWIHTAVHAPWFTSLPAERKPATSCRLQFRLRLCVS